MFDRFQLIRSCVRTVALVGVFARAAGAVPAIEIVSVPVYAEEGFVTGVASGVDFATHQVAPYIYIDGVGWFTKPTFASPTVPLSGAGSFSADVVTGGVDKWATIYCVALIGNSVSPPAANGAVRIPASLAALAMDCQERYGATLVFKGFTWAVKGTPAPVGPNGNWFSDDAQSVWVDGQGMHLKIRFDGSRWTAAEVILIAGETRGSYGLARFQTESRLDILDENATFAFFSWDPHGDGAPPNVTRELDIEDGRWGNPADPTNAQFVVQPYTTPGNLVRYTLPDLTSNARLTRLMSWLPGRVNFTALAGYHQATGFPPSAVIHESVYLDDPSASHFVPDPGRAAFHFNLWLNDAAPLAPASGQEVEVIITDFSFHPPHALPGLSRPAMIVLVLILISVLLGSRAFLRE